MKYQLEKYSGRASRHKCPKCGDLHSFAYYVDESGNMLHRTVGRCNHESGCGYHYTPKQYFADNPAGQDYIPKMQTAIKSDSKVDMGHIPFSYVEQAASYKSSFVHFLCRLFDRFTLESPTIERLMQDYALGATNDGSVIYWQIDIKGRVRTGKVMKYNPETGHRIKDAGGVNWIHSIMKKRKLLPDDYNLAQCFFGEHLLKIYPDKAVALVESEKSALIGSGVFPDYVWLATGGKSQLSIEKLKVLKGRTVIMFPDVDGFEYWSGKAKEAEAIGCKVIVSDLLEKNATDEERTNKIDIADWMIKQLAEAKKQEQFPVNKNDQDKEGISLIQHFTSINPMFRTLIDKFDLVVTNFQTQAI